jgi:peptide/nickel transport system substrate-binding protein
MKLRKNPRRSWYTNLDSVTVDGDDRAVFHLKRRQPSFLALLASGYSPVYPCHVPPAKMRTHPIGTGPFKFVSYRPNESITLARNEHYWKPGRPYLDGIVWTIIKSPGTRVLAFEAKKFDMTFNADITIPTLKEIRKRAPEAICKLVTTNVSTNVIVNQTKPPFNNPDIRRAMLLAIDRKAFIDILGDGKLVEGGAMMPPPEGVWGMPRSMLDTIPGYGPDVEKNRAEARRIMEKLGYGPDHRLPVTVSTRNIAVFRDPAVIFIDQLRDVYMDATLKTVETGRWGATIAANDYMVGMNLTGSGVDDPDAQFYENYACGSSRNYTHYCNPAIEKLIDRQSMMTDRDARRKLVWEIDKKLQEDAARPIIFHNKWATCYYPWVRGLVIHVNSLYNGWRMEDVWLNHE